MRIFFVLFLIMYFAFGYEVSIKDIQNENIQVNKYVKKGVSGIVVCPYGNKEIICARVVMNGTKGRLEVYDNLENDSFALPHVSPKIGDKIILAKDYNRVMIIAPNQKSYLQIKRMLNNKTFISPDIFLTFLSEFPRKEDFVDFAKKMDIGLYAFVLGNKVYLVDAYSFYAIKEYELNENYRYVNPFFVTYTKFKISSSITSKIKNLFSSDIKNYQEYYKSLIKE